MRAAVALASTVRCVPCSQNVAVHLSLNVAVCPVFVFVNLFLPPRPRLQTLVTLCGGLDVVVSRIPEKYCRAIFGSRLASRFIYESGLNTPEFAFFEFVSKSVL